MSQQHTAIEADEVRRLIETHGITTVRATLVDNTGISRARNVSATTFLREGLSV